MNIASYQALKSGIDGYYGGLRTREQMERQLKQQELDNQLRQAMAALQKRQVEAGLAKEDRDFTYRKERDTVGDTRYGEERGYSRVRDTIADTRYGDETTYRRGRDKTGDERDERNFNFTRDRAEGEDRLKQIELALRMGEMRNRANQGYVTEQMDPETGEVISTTRKRPLRSLTAGGPETPPRERAAAGPANKGELLNAVRRGQMTKAEAKAYAKQQGWE